MQFDASNVNVDANVNVNVGANSIFGGQSGRRVRFNTYKAARQAYDMSGDIVPAVPKAGKKYPGYSPDRKDDPAAKWDAEQRAWVYLNELAARNASWIDTLEQAAKKKWPGWSTTDAPNNPKLREAALQVINAAGEREERFAEIIDQHDGEGAINYWLGMLMVDPGRHHNTNLLIRVARKIGEMAVMCLKTRINAARPSQLCPAIIPMIDPPATASYPSGHSLQAYLISYLLLRALPELPQSTAPSSWNSPHHGVFGLSRRIADNRMIAGLHFDIDNEAGFELARDIDAMFGALLTSSGSEFKRLVEAVQEEFPQYR